MADNATINGVIPVLNKKMGGQKSYHLGIKGTFLQMDTDVIVKKGDHEWERDGGNVELQGTTLLLVKLKKKKSPHGSDGKPGDKDLEQITVTVANPGQTGTPASLTMEMATFVEP